MREWGFFLWMVVVVVAINVLITNVTDLRRQLDTLRARVGALESCP